MKHEDSAVTALREVGLFAGLDDKTLGRIAQQTKPYHFSAGESVIDADSSGRFGRLYTVVSGSAEARINDEPVATFGPGDYFGEMSVLDGSPRSAAIIATSDLDTLGLVGLEHAHVATRRARHRDARHRNAGRPAAQAQRSAVRLTVSRGSTRWIAEGAGSRPR